MSENIKLICPPDDWKNARLISVSERSTLYWLCRQLGLTYNYDPTNGGIIDGVITLNGKMYKACSGCSRSCRRGSRGCQSRSRRRRSGGRAGEKRSEKKS